MIRRSGVWCVCMSGSLAHFWRACVTNHTPFNSFALLNSSHHGAIQTAANLPTCSLNVSLLSTDKRNKCLKSNIIKKEKRNYVLTLTLQPGLPQAPQRSQFYWQSSDFPFTTATVFHFSWNWHSHKTKKKKRSKLGKKTIFAWTKWFPVISSFAPLQISFYTWRAWKIT